MLQKLQNTKMTMTDIADVLKESEQVIKRCFTEFQLEEVFLSFNGGKDCTVLLDVTIRVLQNLFKNEDMGKDLKVLYIRTNGPFKEIEDFVKQIELHYRVKLIVTEGELKQALEKVTGDDKKLKACLMGTRRTDPYSENLEFMQKTDSDWPQILRVSPLLNWSYHQIWSYILQRGVPYCSLYDIGYTSIGSTFNTRPNQTLAYTEGGRVVYRPAWQLTDETLERAGRGVICSNGHESPSHVNVNNSILSVPLRLDKTNNDENIQCDSHLKNGKLNNGV